MGDEETNESPDMVELTFIGALTALLAGGLITPLMIAGSLMGLAVLDVLYLWAIR